MRRAGGQDNGMGHRGPFIAAMAGPLATAVLGGCAAPTQAVSWPEATLEDCRVLAAVDADDRRPHRVWDASPVFSLAFRSPAPSQEALLRDFSWSLRPNDNEGRRLACGWQASLPARAGKRVIYTAPLYSRDRQRALVERDDRKRGDAEISSVTWYLLQRDSEGWRVARKEFVGTGTVADIT
jgi:hypothetical protein